MDAVDAHLHVWDLTRSDYAWMTPDLGPLHATFAPEQAQAELEAAGIGSAVLVQAEDSTRDTDLMLQAAHRHPWITGVVGWVHLDDTAAAERELDRLGDEPRLRGVRHLVHDDPRDDFLSLAPVRRSLGLLAARGLAFDVPDAWPRHLRATADLAAALPATCGSSSTISASRRSAARTGTAGGTRSQRSPRTRTRRRRSPGSRCPAGRSRPPRCARRGRRHSSCSAPGGSCGAATGR